MKRRYRVPRFVLLSLALSLSACGRSKTAFSRVLSCVQNLLNELSTPTTSDPNDPVIARVKDLEIRRSDLLMRFGDLPASEKAKFQSPQGKLGLLNWHINQILLAEAADKAGFARDKNIRRILDKQRRNLLATSYRSYLLRTEAAVSESEVQRYYDEHLKDMYGPQTVIQASRIVVRTAQDAAKAQKLLKMKKPFAEVARTLSIDKETASAGGKLPPFHLGTRHPALEAAVLRLRDGQVSAIVPTPLGLQIIRREDVTKKLAIPFEGVKQEIRSRLEQQKINKWLEHRKALTAIEIDQKRLGDTVEFTPPQSAASH